MDTTWIWINNILLLDFLRTLNLQTCNFWKFFWKFLLDFIYGFPKLNFLLDSKDTLRNLGSVWGSYRNVSCVMFIEKLWSGCLNQFGHFLQFCRFNPPETFRPPTHTLKLIISQQGQKLHFFAFIDDGKRKKKFIE